MWFRADGEEMQKDDWVNTNTQCFAMVMDGRAQTSGITKRATDETVLLILNAYHDVVNFKLPQRNGGQTWTLLLDTNVPKAEEREFEMAEIYDVTGRSLLLFKLSDGGATGAE